MYLFVADLNAVSTRSGERELGTVVFKKLTATRKAPSGLEWERMRDNSPVYEADTLRTADLSEASINFDDGTSLDMLEDSMLKLDFGGKAKNLEFLSGQISLTGGSSKGSSYTISSSAGSIKLDQGSKATLSREANNLSVEVTQGSASVVKADGSTQAIAKNQELQVDLTSGQSQIVTRPIVPTSPEPNARLLASADARASLGFAWELGGASAASAKASSSYTLELSSTKGFESTAYSLRCDSSSASLPIAGAAAGPANGGANGGAAGGAQVGPLADGTWYWRVRDEGGEISEIRKFSLESDPFPRPAFPPDGDEYSYRRVKPELRFAWTGMDAASAYLFELGQDPSLSKPRMRSRVATTNLSVDDLGEGTWYWRVSPVHAYTLVGEAPKAEVRRFTIKKIGAMTAIDPATPFEGSLYQVQDLGGKGLAFAWMPQAEAVSYELVLSSSKDLDSPLATIGSTLPYMTLSGGDSAAIKRPGRYYWGLRWKDKEGNLSPFSPPRSLVGVDGSIAIRPSFPPEGYRIADSLITNTRFAWKSNVPARTVFQVAKDSLFEDSVYQETVSAETLLGRPWPSGTYYWRLRTYNTDGSVFLDTEPRSFQVVEPLAGPSLLKPAPESSFYLRERDAQELAWQKIEHADYYTFKLFSPADGYAVPVLEKTFVEGTSLTFVLGDLPGGLYKASVQAFTASGEGTTRIIGYIGGSSFDYKRLTYITLAAPADTSSIAGLAMRRKGQTFSYGSSGTPDSAELQIYADPAGQQLVKRVQDRSGSILVKGLVPGKYYWTVKGSLVGFDISSKQVYGLTVEVIPPLPPAELLAPPRGFSFGPAELKSRRFIALSWKPVDGATDYSLRLYARGRQDPVVQLDGLRDTSYSIQDLSILDKGDYSWKVTALAHDETGDLEQPGLDSISTFVINLPRVMQAQPQSEGSYFGY
jgi:hypothetical protein